MEKREKQLDFQGFRSPNTTPLPDEFFDFVLYYLTGAETKVCLYIARRTFGWKKPTDNISLMQMVNGITKKTGEILDRGTGLSKSSVAKAVNSLVEMNVVIRNRRRSVEKGDEPTTYSLNVIDDPVSRKWTPPSAKKRQGGVQKMDTQQTVLQETVNNHVNVAFNQNGTQNPREAQLVEEMVSQLGDTRSQASFTIIARAFDEQVIWSMLGNTKEAHQMDLIKTTKAKYFMGMAKKKAKEQGIDLGFKNGKTEAPPDNGLAQFDALKSQIGKRFRKAVRESTRQIES